MELTHRFEVPAPVDEVWTLLLDLERVAPCLPGATLGERVDDTTYDVAIAIKLGPMQMTYGGRVEIVETDEAAHRAVMRAKTTEKRGQGTADATITTTLSAVDGGTLAESVTDLRLTGRVAQMGRGIVEDVSNRLLAQFAECLSTTAAAGAAESASAAGTEAPGAEAPAPAAAKRPEPQAIGGFSLALAVIAGRLRRLFGRGSAS